MKLGQRKEIDSEAAILALLNDVEGYIKIAVHMFDESAKLSGNEGRIVIDDGFKY